MKNTVRKILWTLVLITAFPVNAAEPIKVMLVRSSAVFREPNGTLSPASIRYAGIIEQKARRVGEVALWLTLNTPFNVDPSSMSPEEAAAQAKTVSEGFAEILEPLMEKGLISHPGNEPSQLANGCKVLATAKGVRALVSDERILHIFETRTR